MFRKQQVHTFRLKIVKVDSSLFHSLLNFAERLNKINPNVQVEVEIEKFEIGD